MTRNFIFTTIAILFFASCREEPEKGETPAIPSNSGIKDVQLIDTLGTISLAVPNRYDTFFVWTDHSDCGKRCDMQKYRFQPAILKIIKESGFFRSNKPKDSVESLTISHSGFFPFYRIDTAKDLIRHRQLREQLASVEADLHIVFDTIERVNDRYFSIVAMEKFDLILSEKVVATTTINGNEITFEYYLLTKKDDSISRNCIKNSLDLIKTIRISKGM